ncbi:hypothetical protein IFM89_000930 [Coptis chinensis]|uniref:Protein kinase domain-containing protein n=1 Tax=Coptis chinensis TaxID=261450 RepID=A0A835M406_9MAGN|nr:hypothetical protein IFM89_000930 [Coptis chinensis]
MLLFSCFPTIKNTKVKKAFDVKKNIEQDYVLGAEIAEGSCGLVRKCRSKANGGEFACKTLCKSYKYVRREIDIMQYLSGHPSVVTLYAVYEDSDSFHLVMELCSGGSLFDRFQEKLPLTEHQAAVILKELVVAIKYCHDMGIVHRDIKPRNVLLTSSGKIKLADFGISARITPGQRLSSKTGTPAYLAPEVLAGKYSEKVDIWSAGVIFHALLVGYEPFDGYTTTEVLEALRTKTNLNFDGGIWESVISKPARDLIKRMLTRDVSSRLTADEVLRHLWDFLESESKHRNSERGCDSCEASLKNSEELTFANLLFV